MAQLPRIYQVASIIEKERNTKKIKYLNCLKKMKKREQKIIDEGNTVYTNIEEKNLLVMSNRKNKSFENMSDEEIKMVVTERTQTKKMVRLWTTII